MAEEEFIVAVDVGGTLTKIAYADPTGSLTGSARLSTHLADGRRRVGALACGHHQALGRPTTWSPLPGVRRRGAGYRRRGQRHCPGRSERGLGGRAAP